ncbi:MAG: IS256 family transposase [Balneolaceae bacterium]|nr:IS256 family transposase [Balneolaceae bacterium]
MSKKVKPSERVNKAIEELLDGSPSSDDLLTELIRLGAERILQEASEGEVDEFLGRGWYERGREEQEHNGYRNGYTPVTFKTTQGPITLQRPRIRDNQEPFESKLLSRIDRIEDRLVKLSAEMYVRGLSTRDIEETLVDGQGTPILSRNLTSQLSEELYTEYQRWSQQDLSEYDVVYLFVDGVYESVRKYTGGQTILCAWGICSDGRKVLLGLEAVASESKECWQTFFEDLKERGLAHPLLVVSDGAGGIASAIARSFPLADRGRCIAHKMRNVMNKLPRDKQITDPIKARLKAIYYAPDLETAHGLSKAFITDYGEQYPGMVKCFNDDLPACLVHLNYPHGHRRSIRTTNLIERSFVEQKRRTKIIPSHVNEKGAMKLVYGTLIRAARRWQRVTMDEHDLILLKTLRQTMCEKHHISLTDNRISFNLAA